MSILSRRIRDSFGLWLQPVTLNRSRQPQALARAPQKLFPDKYTASAASINAMPYWARRCALGRQDGLPVDLLGFVEMFKRR